MTSPVHKLPLVLATALLVSGCAALMPPPPAIDAGIDRDWAWSQGIEAPPMEAVDLDWQAFFVDARLHRLIEQALEHNRDLRVAALNVERARAQYRIQGAERLPGVGINGSMTRTGGDPPVSTQYSVGVGIAEFELDLFGRINSLSEAALSEFLATGAAQRSVRLALIAEVAGLWLTLAADLELQRIAEATLESHETGFALTQQRYELGAVSALDLAQARTVVESVRADAARLQGQVAQDLNALRLLVGGSIDSSLLPPAFTPEVSAVPALPAAMPSSILLRRPDIVAAEHRLLAANARIGAARAAFFPAIRLTGSIGTASPELSGLFDSGTRVWSFVPAIHLPIFQGGRLRAALGAARVDRDIAIAEYERAIQSGFREVADALALSGTLARQIEAQQALAEAAERAHELSEARYRAGRDSFLNLLEAQRTLYSARQSQVAVQLTEQLNRVTLYKALGGGWPVPATMP